MNRPRQLLAYGTVSIFLVFIAIFGFADTLNQLFPKGSRRLFGSSGHLIVDEGVNKSVLDFSRYKVLSTLSSKQFPLDDPTKRVIVVGDIHGMLEPFEKLLKTVKFSPSKDILFHVGDIITKGPHKGSLAVLQYMSSNNITGVRGNHDQLVIEWRSWRNWVSSRPCGKEWLDKCEKKWDQAQAQDPSISLLSWLKDEKQASSATEKSWWRSIPRGGVLLDDHYRVAKEMSESQYRYLLDLPLRLYIPSAHAFIVHAGLLSYDPRYPVNDAERQPLARMPTLTRHQSGQLAGLVDEDFMKDLPEDSDASLGLSENAINALRNLQEIGILAQIPQNNDPWVTLNIRSIIKNGKISKEASGGTSWSKVWQQHMKSCNGYQRKDKVAGHDGVDQSNDLIDLEEDGITKKLDLKCYPSTTIYGHAAARGLDVKRWSFGLDSGCVYGKSLSALIIKGQSTKKPRHVTNSDRQNSVEERSDEDESVGDQREDDTTVIPNTKGKHNRWLPFGDNHSARIISTKCHT